MTRRFIIAFMLLLISAPLAPVRAAEPTVKLVLQITVDQLRGDMPLRFAHRFGGGGFRRLMEQGVFFTNAHYRHSTTFTACGHATLFTGGNPAHHGIAGNEWFDAASGREVYCCEDDRHKLLGVPTRDHAGASPRNLTTSTTGDELVASSGGKSRVFSVSLKDRGAILPGGHRGKAFWWAAGKFITSTYYYDAEPRWLTQWNEKRFAERYRGTQWNLLHDRRTYSAADRDDDPSERPYKTMGRVFPHPLDGEKPEDLYEILVHAPMGDEMTAAFVKHLIAEEKLGQGPATDMLAVSFTCTDYVGHCFGPDSLEAEDNLLRLDRTLADLLTHVDQTIGPGRVLVVLSADHGVDSAPEYRHAQTCGKLRESDRIVYRTPGEVLMKFLEGQGRESMCCAAGRHEPAKFIEQANAALSLRFGVGDLVKTFKNPSLYLDLAAVQKHKLDVATVERALAEFMLSVPGIAASATRTDLLAGRVPQEPLMQKVQRSFHPQRSGNVLIVQQPYWFLYPDPFRLAAMHGSPYSYDTHVPVMFLGPGVTPARINRRVGPEDIAPTLCDYLGIEAPGGSVGDVLTEVRGLSAPAR